jgi:hypothetical protein
VTSPLVAIEIALGAVVDGKRCGPKRWYRPIASAEPGRPSRETKRRLTTVREPIIVKEIAENDNEANENKRAAAAIWEATGELTSASLVHDADFRKPRCTFPFGSSTFHAPGYFGASARLRVLECLLFRLDLSHSSSGYKRCYSCISNTPNLYFGFVRYAKRPCGLGRESRLSVSKAASTQSKTG